MECTEVSEVPTASIFRLMTLMEAVTLHIPETSVFSEATRRFSQKALIFILAAVET
jgi:hypothetical protein